MDESLRILLIGYNSHDRALAMRELQREFPKLQVLQVTEAQELTQALERGNFDLVITDYRLGWTDGLTILQAVKCNYPSCPVIMFTATGSTKIAAQAMQAGLDDYVFKTPAHYARLAAAVRSVIEQAQQHQAPPETQARQGSLLGDAPVALYRITTTGKIIDANPAMVQMLGYPDRESLLAVSMAELWVNAKDYQRWQSLIEREEIVYNFETQLRRYDGTIICVDNRAQALYAADGQTLYYDGCLEDITEQVQIEVALRHRNRELALINRASQAFNSTLDLDRVLITVLEEVRYLLDIVASSAWLIDPDSGELVCRHATGPRSEITRGWRLAPGEGIVGWVAQNGQSLIVPDVWLDARHFKGVDRQTGLALRAILSVPLQVKGRVIGVLQVVDAEVDRFKPADLALIEPLAASAAIAIENARLYATEQQRAVALARALEKQQELDRLKNEFIQNVSHELRTPLAIIRGYAEMMVAGELGAVDDGWQEILTIVVRRARILNNLIEDITAILQNEALQTAQEPVSMVELIRTSLDDFQGLADQAGLTLRGEIAESVPQISGDIAHLRKVVDNLVSNALKFTPAGGTVTLKLHSTGEEVVFQVSDTGIGIAPEHHERIFDRFYQVNGSTRRRYGGTGLGLALVKEVVEAHGGTVSIESQPDQGTTFTVSLPCAKD